jgi:hypothetical protein
MPNDKPFLKVVYASFDQAAERYNDLTDKLITGHMTDLEREELSFFYELFRELQQETYENIQRCIELQGKKEQDARDIRDVKNDIRATLARLKEESSADTLLE